MPKGLCFLPVLLATACSVPQFIKGTPKAIRGALFEEGAAGAARPIAGIGRAHFPLRGVGPAVQAHFDQGLALLHGGWHYEAERSFHQVVAMVPEHPMGHWGRSLAFEAAPHIAVLHAWEAWQRREAGSAIASALVAATAEYLDATQQPEMEIVNAEWGTRRAVTRPPDSAARARWAEALGGLAEQHTDQPELAALAALASAPLDAARAARWARGIGADHPARRHLLSSWPLETVVAWPQRCPAVPTAWQFAAAECRSRGALDAAIQLEGKGIEAAHRYIGERGVAPHLVPGYERAIVQLADDGRNAGRPELVTLAAGILRSSPLHPKGIASGATPPAAVREALLRSANSEFQVTWERPSAAHWSLPCGQGGTRSLADFRGRPVLMVFFLGFGCLHCVEQLRQMEPRAADFARAGIQVVTVGTDTLDGVRASLQATMETSVEPFPFPVLADPEGHTFKNYGCWDDFDNEALHGTFLISGEGKMLWHDVSVEPFMETEFLLEECQRLLARD